MKGLLTAGGRGTRMRPLTFSSNKHLIPIANKPLLHYAIEEMVEAGISEIGINYNPGQLEELKEKLGTGKQFGAKFTFILQDYPGGLAHIIKVSEEFLGKDKFVMHLGDNIFFGGIKKLVEKFEKSGANGMITMLHHSENSRLGVPYFDKTGKFEKYVEKPSNPPHDFGIPGIYFFDHHVFECFSGKKAIKPSARGELEVGETYNWMMRQGYKVETAEFDGIWRDPGKFDDWIATNRFILDQTIKNTSKSKVDKSVSIEGRVQIGQKCKIKNSKLRGPIIIGDGVIIENSFIGPYTSIGNECAIKSVKIENSVLMKKVTIEEIEKSLDTCLIGEETVISSTNHKFGAAELFVGNQCVLKM